VADNPKGVAAQSVGMLCLIGVRNGEQNPAFGPETGCSNLALTLHY